MPSSRYRMHWNGLILDFLPQINCWKKLRNPELGQMYGWGIWARVS
jgi:hypothetical protein